MSLVLMRPEIDVWSPGEHTGTFRGNNLGFVGASAAILAYWQTPDFQRAVQDKSAFVRRELESLLQTLPSHAARIKGAGMLMGLEFAVPTAAAAISQRLFQEGLIAETCGAHDEVLKLMPPLTIPWDELSRGIGLLRRATMMQLGCG